MKRPWHTPEQIARKLREGERLLNEGKGHHRGGAAPRDRREHLESLAVSVRRDEERPGEAAAPARD